MFEQPVLGVENQASFEAVRGAVASALAPAAARRFLQRLDSGRMRVRDFESILERGLLGRDAIEAYGQLGNLDRGQIREFYLESIEKVAPELRAKYLKVYAYY